MSGPGRRGPLWAVLIVCVWATSGFAHVLDEFLQATLVSIEPEGIRLHINLTPGVEIADQVIPHLDRDGDGVISNDEESAYMELLHRDFIVRLDGREAELTWKAVRFPAVAELRTGDGIIQVVCVVATGGLAGGTHRVIVENRHFPALGAYLINAARPESRLIEIRRQKRSDNQSMGEIEYAYTAAAASGGMGTAVVLAILLAGGLGVVGWISLRIRRRGRAGSM